ncbi:hypothetical protein GCM10023219_22010 [Stakelama sediminis]|uniref:Uncharacterized protein n=1 Tax=Stakelama sediminis TaxID=463200 RepID=A0A840Z0A0_9SPHN|nr:hypothetical protein [Stakelama sediminis]MBB5719156.1 hypothetical protein [Stakelama sediminis]
MTGKGRPLRFAALVLLSWTVARGGFLWWETGEVPHPAHILIADADPPPPPVRDWFASPSTLTTIRALPPFRAASASSVAATPSKAPPATGQLPRATDGAVRERFALVGMIGFAGAQSVPAQDQQPVLRPTPSSMPSPPDRWQGSAWLYVRGPGDSGVTGVPQLGGSQFGMRIAYMLLPKSHLAATARTASPLSGPGAEAMLGLAWKPTRAPVTLTVEQRFSLDHHRGGPALAAIAGSGPTPVAHGLDLETYGEAGAVFRSKVDYYAAGAARISHAVGRIGNHPVTAGMGGWASVQRDAARVDIGPSLAIALPVQKSNTRLTLEWRQRLAGRAEPGSGPALTLGADF